MCIRDSSSFQDSLDALGLSGAITVDVENVTYNEAFEINDVTGSSATNTITINGNNALITSSAGETINIEEQTYVTIKHLRIRNTNSTGECMRIQGDGTSFITVDSSEFIKNGSIFSSGSVYLMISEGTTAFGNGSDEKTNITITNNYFHNDGGSSSQGAYAGIAVHQDPSEGGDQDILIANNRISCWGRYAITLEDVSGMEIIGNEMFNPTNFSDGYRQTVYHFNNFAFVGAEEKSVVSHNYIHDINRTTYTGTTMGIAWYEYYNENSVDIENNVIDLNTRGSMYGIYLYGTFYGAPYGNKNARHNTINITAINGSNTYMTSGIYGFNMVGSDLSNNNIKIARQNGNNVIGIYDTDAQNNNIYFDNTNVTNERYVT